MDVNTNLTNQPSTSSNEATPVRAYVISVRKRMERKRRRMEIGRFLFRKNPRFAHYSAAKEVEIQAQEQEEGDLNVLEESVHHDKQQRWIESPTTSSVNFLKFIGQSKRVRREQNTLRFYIN